MTSLRHKSRSSAPTPSPTPERAARDAYLDAARSLILDVGWRRSTLTEVARRAGVSRMTIYRTWPDMERLLSDLMTREWGELVARVVEGADGREAWIDRLVDGIADTVLALRGNELFWRIVDLDPETLLPYLLERRGRSQDAIAELLADRIAQAQAEGAVRAGDPMVLARSLILLAHGFTLSVHTMVDDRVTEQALDAELRHTLRRALQP